MTNNPVLKRWYCAYAFASCSIYLVRRRALGPLVEGGRDVDTRLVLATAGYFSAMSAYNCCSVFDVENKSIHGDQELKADC